jgi:phosphatidylserine/phosphatidylglycerophosphate/cardiolipin synthase-like enzyme
MIRTRLCLLFLLIIFETSPVYARQSIHTAFAPSPQAIELVEGTINGAEKSIHLAAYSFTSQKVTDALLRAHKRGVDVRMILDKSQVKKPRQVILDLHAAGIPIRVSYKYAIMHNKYIIVDKETVETGSFNFTASAEKRNAENVIVIRNNPRLAKRYLVDWQRLWDEGKDYKDRDDKSGLITPETPSYPERG